MSEFRQDPTTREWVIMAPERAKRPQAAPRERPAETVPDWDESCPFCPGNEINTPDETFRLPASGHISDWEVRVVPNRFAAVTLEGDSSRTLNREFYRRMDGFGVHEVIIETPSHNAPMALMSYPHVENVLTAYRERYDALKTNPQLNFITIFKNHGRAAGTSLVHPHSQLVATPIITPYYHRRFDVAHDYHADTGHCLYCDLIAEEIANGERIIALTKEFIVFHPYAARGPWETWIMPQRHYASFGLLPATHLQELAMVLKDTLFCFYRGLDNPAFNLIIDTSTTMDEHDPYYHWLIKIIPRLTTVAGFEIGSGIYVNPSIPEETALLMREICNSCDDGECISLR
ncbi:galactose-1-phosphate uridylyltransferase [Chloroflexota bacterium]